MSKKEIGISYVLHLCLSNVTINYIVTIFADILSDMHIEFLSLFLNQVQVKYLV